MFLLFHVFLNFMVIELHFAFELVDNFVYFNDFLIESYYFKMLVFVSFVVLVHFVFMIQKELVDK